MRIAIPLFDRVTALDAIGPYEVLSRLPDASVHFVAAEPGEKRTDTRALGLTADLTLSDLSDPEVLVVPGGYGTRALLHDEELAPVRPARAARRAAGIPPRGAAGQGRPIRT